MKRLSLMVILLAALIPATFPAYACSGGGGPESWEEVLSDGAIFAYVEVIQTDLYHQNALVRVREVLYGDAPETILINRNQPGQTVGVAEGFLGNGDCNFVDPPLTVGDRVYTTLGRYEDGSYWGLGMAYTFATAESTVTDGLGEEEEPIEVDEATFRERIAEFGGQTPHAPTPSDFPRFASLEITTDSGAVFVVPVDNGAPIALDSARERRWAEVGFWVNYMDFAEDEECLPETCAISADGGMIAKLNDRMVSLPMAGGSAPAEVFALSPVSGWIAVIVDDVVKLYSTGFARSGGNPFNPTLNAEVMSIARDVSRQPSNNLIWSADGTQLAYADSAGVWVWQVTTYNSASACCVIPIVEQLVSVTGDDLLARPTAFSPDGTFLRVEQGESAEWIRVFDKNDTYPDGFWSPDDRMLINTTDDALTACATAFFFRCETAHIRLQYGADETSETVILRDIAWHSPFVATLWACVPDVEDSCGAYPYQMDGIWHRHYTLKPVLGVRLFEYQPELDHLALVVGDTLIIDGKPIDVSGIDGEITALRWLRPLWAK